MLILKNSKRLIQFLKEFKSGQSKRTIGFVPTMGALHKGHVSLVANAKKHCDIVVCSIFVNPTQFNKTDDLEGYPRTPEADINILKQANCDILFMPSESDMYPDGTVNSQISFNGLDEIMEGKFRPGHFDGVVTIVNQFFTIIKPDFAFFGEKDFQQLAIIQQFVNQDKMNVEIVSCPTQRSEDGLALSSRNKLLSDKAKRDALIIYETLLYGINGAKKGDAVIELKNRMTRFFNSGNLTLEYMEIVRKKDLTNPKFLEDNCICCIAAICDEVRLIDNMAF